MPTAIPKASPSEITGLLVLLNSHKGSEDVALLADDLDLEIDEILPSLEFAEVLGLVKVVEGRATFTELGRRLVQGTIRDRKAIVREQLRRTALFKTILRALENAPDHSLSDEELTRIVAFTTTPADEAVQNIVNWGRYAGLFRYDSDARRLLAPLRTVSGRAGSTRPPPPGGSTSSTEKEEEDSSAASASGDPELRSAGVSSIAV